VALLCLLAATHIHEDAEHHTVDDSGVGALAACGNPADFVIEHDAEVDLVGARDGARRYERRAHPVAVGGMDMGGKLLERDFVSRGQAPQVEGALVHRESVAVYLPRPQGYPGSIYRGPEMFRPPNLRSWALCRQG